ncbi:MAG: hypothetical protein EBZ48_11870, partial [Proteobacteria bacterium]|nr:hypothetical protein [Pseudomonadota bacterium]
YWVPYSIPPQNAVFFRKDLLRGLDRSPGKFFDDDLHISMDYDLWLRMTIRTPFLKHLNRRVAYVRMIETKKTGTGQGGAAYAEPELSRAYRRAETLALAPTVSFSVLLPVSGVTDALQRTIESVLQQTIGDFELLLIARDLSPEVLRELKQMVRERNLKQKELLRDSYLRLVVTSTRDLFGSLADGVNAAEGRHVVVLTEGALLGSDFLATSLRALSSNRVGMILPWKSSFEVYQALVPPSATRNSKADFDFSRLFEPIAFPVLFAARRVVMIESGEVLRPGDPQRGLRELIATVLFKGWHVTAQQELQATAVSATEEECAHLRSNSNRYAAEIITEIDKRLHTELFAMERAKHGCALAFDAKLVQNCRDLLERSQRPG